MNTLELTNDQVDAIYDVLVDLCGAPLDERLAFILQFPGCGEYRFGGALGFGGKVYADSQQVWVSYYPENHTPETDKVTLLANQTISRIIDCSDED